MALDGGLVKKKEKGAEKGRGAGFDLRPKHRMF